MPASLVDVPYKPIKDLDFTSSKTMKQKHDTAIKEHSSSSSAQKDAVPKPKNKIIPNPTEAEVTQLLTNISKCGTKPAILSLVSPFSDSFVPNEYGNELPVLITDLTDSTTFNLSHSELLDKCKNIKRKLCVSKEQSITGEKETREQSSSSKWFKLRAGRITASRTRAVLPTNPLKPSLNLIKQICYPEAFKFSTKATQWGCAHEKTAQELYSQALSKNHKNFHIRNSGLVISTTHQFLGASPDGIISCDCCGTGLIEIKCPHCKKDTTINEAAEDNKFCLKEISGVLQLDQNHPYYFQVQQLFHVCNDIMECKYTDFVVWTKKEIFIQRILPDSKFWAENLEKLEQFWDICILPEIVGKFYTNLNNETTQSVLKQVPENAESPYKSNDKDLWCSCRGTESDRMVGCDNQNCQWKWFHFDCVGIKRKPKSNLWYCPDCRKLPQFKTTKNRK